MKDVIIIAGPTAVGKTKLGIELAKKLNTEIISADSMQIYRKMDIGTAKVTNEEMDGIKHHLIDIIDANENFSAQEFQKKAYEIFDKLHNNNQIPIVVGGTGLYIDSLTHNFDFLGVKPDRKLRKELEKIYDNNPTDLLNRLSKIDKNHYSHINVLDKKKIIRAIEVFEKSGKLVDYNRENNNDKYKYHLYVLTDDRKLLYDRINSRVCKMMDDGLIEEVKGLLDSGVSKDSQSMKAIGYKEVISYLNGEIRKDIMIDLLKKNSRHYSKRQLTWFRRNEFSNWINVSENSICGIIDKIITKLGGDYEQ